MFIGNNSLSLRKLAAGALLSLGLLYGPQAQAVPISAIYTWDFTLASGADALGLNGASANLSMTFDTTQTYIDRFAFAAQDALSHTLTISGASAGSSNGAHSDPDGLAIYPRINGIFFGGGAINGSAAFAIGATFLQFTGLVSSTAAGQTAIVGDNLDASHFGTTLLQSHFIVALLSPGDGSIYNANNFIASIVTGAPAGPGRGTPAVPEPGTLALFGLGLVGLGFARRRKIA